jgi:ABC-type antimicrobial peptide transport system permease subunit
MGIYSLMAFLTAQRTQEIGVRMALGAGRWQVVRATTRRALMITVVGAMIGSVLALAIGRVLRTAMSVVGTLLEVPRWKSTMEALFMQAERTGSTSLLELRVDLGALGEDRRAWVDERFPR